MVRGIARGWRVAVVQFVKSGDWKVGEEKVGRQLGVDWLAVGDGFTWDSDDLEHDKALAREGWNRAADLIAAGEHQLVILDELTYLCTWGWIDVAGVVATFRDRPKRVNIVVTGRDATAELVEHRRHRDGDARDQARLPAGHPRHARHRLLMLTLLLGGARSGKSALAVEMGRRHDGDVTFVATSPPSVDPAATSASPATVPSDRTGRVIEEPFDLAGALGRCGDALVIVDCLTLWVSNHMARQDSDDMIELASADAIASATTRLASTVVISNEVGLGVHPETALGLRYRDLLGRINQQWARAAATTLLLTAGRALRLDDPWTFVR